jgi:hypothetical protein
MEVERRMFIKFLRFTGIKWLGFCHDVTLAFGEEVYIFASVKD